MEVWHEHVDRQCCVPFRQCVGEGCGGRPSQRRGLFVKDFACKLNGTDVMMNVMDPGWLRTDLGGPNAPNAPESVIPGSMVSVMLDDKKSGRWFSAQEFTGMSLAEAVEKGKSVE